MEATWVPWEPGRKQGGGREGGREGGKKRGVDERERKETGGERQQGKEEVSENETAREGRR